MTVTLTVWDLVVVGNITVMGVFFSALGVLLVYYLIKFILSIATGG